MTDKKRPRLGEFKATDETATKDVCGVSIEYLATPKAKTVTSICREHTDDIDTMNFALASHIIQSHELTREDWDEMGSPQRTALTAIVWDVCGLSQSFRG